ncbi:hypothetical protein Mro03_70490 [Microbispora rosea subsp. rosea]|nr:hypothetical protein Mro03_70490 [Microbispora rosea subsp. rosea]
MIGDEGQAKPRYLSGRKAARVKAGILAMSLWATSHPTFGMPKRKRHLAAAPDATADVQSGRACSHRVALTLADRGRGSRLAHGEHQPAAHRLRLAVGALIGA